MLTRLLYHLPNHQKLVNEVRQIIDKIQPAGNQIICQTLTENVEDWFTGTGKVNDLLEKDEKKYKYVQPSLEGTEIQKLIDQHNAFRTRIMIMPGRHSYSVHNDVTPRIHVPIISNPQAWMIWPFDSVCTRLSEGFVYWTDTTKEHTFMNGSTEQRIHLVMCVEE